MLFSLPIDKEWMMNPNQMWDAIGDLIFAVPLGVVLLLMMFKARKKNQAIDVGI